jgi:hypothetical protein
MCNVCAMVRTLETGDWRPETGDWRLETGDWRLLFVSLFMLNFEIVSPHF